VGFLRVIIEEDRVRMEKKKVQGVIEWPVLKSIVICKSTYLEITSPQ